MFARWLEARCTAALLAFAVVAAPVAADELADFHSALEQASDQYDIAMRTLETRGQDETAAAVQRLRSTWHAIGELFGSNRPAAFADDENFSARFMQVDVSFVGVLLVIDLGNRDAARAALTPVGEALARLTARSAPPAR